MTQGEMAQSLGMETNQVKYYLNKLKNGSNPAIRHINAKRILGSASRNHREVRTTHSIARAASNLCRQDLHNLILFQGLLRL